MKWREGNTGRWAYAKTFTGRKKRVLAVVSEHVNLAQSLGVFSYTLVRGNDAFNSLWVRPAFATAEEAMTSAEATIDEGYPKERTK